MVRKNKKLKWQGFTIGDRMTIIEKTKDAILIHNGFILNFNMFSDLAIYLRIETVANNVRSLHSAIAQIIEISEIYKSISNLNSTDDYLIDLHISFGSGKGELILDIPAVPG